MFIKVRKECILDHRPSSNEKSFDMREPKAADRGREKARGSRKPIDRMPDVDKTSAQSYEPPHAQRKYQIDRRVYYRNLFNSAQQLSRGHR